MDAGVETTAVNADKIHVAINDNTAPLTLFFAKGIIVHKLAMNSAEYSNTGTYAPTISETTARAVATADNAIILESFIICNYSSS